MNVRGLHQHEPQELRLQMALAVMLFVAGAAMSGAALFRIAADNQHLAQASAPQTSPAGVSVDGQMPRSAVPAERSPETRPTTPAPEPARPDGGAQRSGAPAALLPAPAEKTAPPIPAK